MSRELLHKLLFLAVLSICGVPAVVAESKRPNHERFVHDHSDDCMERVDSCASNEKTFFDCPIACSQSLRKPSSLMMQKDTLQLNDVKETKANGDILDFDDVDGYVLMFAVVPLLPGMAQFYYEVLEQIRAIHPYELVTVILPYQVETDGNEEAEIKPHKKSKTIILEKTIRPTAAIEYFESAGVVHGENDTPGMPNDRVSVTVVSINGVSMQRLISPTLKQLEAAAAAASKEYQSMGELRNALRHVDGEL